MSRGLQPLPIELTEQQRTLPEQIVRTHTNPHYLVQRADIVLTVAGGRVIAPSIGPTRTEGDFLNHITQTVATNPQGD